MTERICEQANDCCPIVCPHVRKHYEDEPCTLSKCRRRNGKVRCIPYNDKAMKKYEKLKPCTMVEMEKEFCGCSDFRNAVHSWIDKNFMLNEDISLLSLVKVAELNNGISCLINKGFIKINNLTGREYGEALV